MWEVIERAQVAAPPGRVRQVVDELRPDDADGRAWWFVVSPSWQGSEVEHGCRATRDSGDVAPGDVRTTLRATLADVKRRAETR